MNSELPLLPLSEIVRGDSPITYGVVKPGEEDPSGVPFVRSGDVNGGNIDITSLRTITDEVSSQYRRTLLEGGEILVSLVGNPGQAAIVPDCLKGANIARQVALLRIAPDFSRDYIYYYLTSRQGRDSLVAYSKGSVQQVINLGDLQKVEIPIPPIDQQKAIAHILGTLDSKIELNRKTNETLEGIAKALFKSWFVDFEPVRAKAEGRPTGLPDEISELFPDSFEDSELGEIPSGWAIGSVGECIGELFDGPHATPKESSSGNIFLGIKNMTGCSLDLAEARLIGDDDWEKWTKRVTPRQGDIVFTYEAALGMFAIIPPGLTCCLGRRMALVRPREEEGCSYFWFHQFVAAPFQRLISERAIHGATVNRTPLTEFPEYPVLIPPKSLKNMFNQVSRPIWEKTFLLSSEAKIHSSIRDALLQKLISGELRVPDAEKILEEVGI
jgi:type I restriction enzyme S subunit